MLLMRDSKFKNSFWISWVLSLLYARPRKQKTFANVNTFRKNNFTACIDLA